MDDKGDDDNVEPCKKMAIICSDPTPSDPTTTPSANTFTLFKLKPKLKRLGCNKECSIFLFQLSILSFQVDQLDGSAHAWVSLSLCLFLSRPLSHHRSAFFSVHLSSLLLIVSTSASKAAVLSPHLMINKELSVGEI